MRGSIIRAAALLIASTFVLAGCNKEAKHDESAEAPPKAVVEKTGDARLFKRGPSG